VAVEAAAEDSDGAIVIGRRIGPYEIVAKLGEGGMGEVYRARDTTLNRDVAIKVLPESLSDDLDRLARFKREAESLAALNHPHIAQVYGFDSSGDTRAIVMELVPGRPLSDHIGGSGLPIDEALAIARQVALALEAAHERNIVHRDLKPANIMVRDDGVVKVLDFGLAKALDQGPDTKSGSDAALTVTSPARTQLGLILGTAAYMAPEQARGKPVDRRADLWAFGCVVYEMLTGRSPFRGEDVQQTLANILNSAPDFTALPQATPASITRLLRRCLTRDRTERLADAASARLEIDDAMKEPSAVGGARGVVPRQPWWWRPVPWPAAAAVAAIGIAGVLWMRPASPRTPASMVTRLDVAVPIGDDLSEATDGGGPALTADGRTLFYVGRRAGTSHVFMRRLDEATAEIVPGTEGALRVYLYPSEDWLAFSVNRPPGLKRLPLAGGPATPVVVAQSNVLGVAFTAGGDLVYGSQGGALFRVPAGGGTPEVLRPMGDDGPMRFPVTLPANRGLLLTVGGVPVSNRIAVLPAGATALRFLTSGTDARYLPTGHLVFWREGSLFAAAFDLDRLDLVGDAVPVVQGVSVRGNGSASFAVSPNGTLAYINAVGAPSRTLVWVDRQGGETAINASPGPYAVPRLSPDGQKVLLSYRNDATEDIWLHDIARQVTEPFVNEPASEWLGVWAANGERVLFSSRREGPFRLYAKQLNGLGGISRIGDIGVPFGLTQNGSDMLSPGQRGAMSLMAIADGSTRLLWNEDNIVLDARFSPDGRWIAYEIGTPRGPQIWMRPYPDVQSNRWRISPDRGRLPRWSPDSRTIFYRGGSDMMAVHLGSGAAPAPATPVRLFGGAYQDDFDIGRDGRFLMIKEPASPPPPERRIVIVLNWFQELIAKVGRR
jgi:Tol biopolymer transport system component